ncbi:MAG: replication factor C small subunit [Candidatus Nanoarchaeia archaeon]
MLDIWTEKYRPRKLSEIKGQEEITRRLMAFVRNKNFPHLLFAGPAGVGKTTAAIAMARELYGENWQDNILELNASDERGIDVIRVKVKDFARTKAVETAPFKLIYMDESDALTKEAQDALRRIMEDYTTTTRFILSCNYSSKIIPPIQSRCAIFRFKPLAKEIVEDILMNVAKAEGLQLEKDAAELIYEASEGDMRKAHNLMQACAAVSQVIDKKTVSQVVSFAEPKEIELVVKNAINGKFLESKKILVDIMVKHGLSGIDVIKQIQKEIQNLEINEKTKVELIKTCGEYEFRLVEGSNEFIQLFALLAEFAIIGGKND